MTSRIKQINGVLNQEYQKFLSHLVSDGMSSFFEEYSFLARLITVTVENWIETIKEFLNRLFHDKDKIINLFLRNNSFVVEGIDTGISDFHNGGRSVFKLIFQDGKILIYKPKDIHLENAFSSFIEWLTEHYKGADLKAPQVLERPGYGWVEYINHMPCQNEEEVRKYFIRSGMLLFLLYIWEGTDIHYENIIAYGEYPVLIDMETLLHPKYPKRENQDEEKSAQDIASQRIWKSVLRTMMLPNWMVRYDGQRFNVSGLSMEPLEEKQIDNAKINMPMFQGKTIPAELYRTEIESGFSQLARYFAQNKHFFCSDSSPLHLFKDAKVRFIFRNTGVYNQLINRLLFHKYLRDGIDSSIEIDILSLSFLNSKKKPIEWPILRYEHLCLLKIDIPYFYTYTTDTSLYLDEDTKFDGYFDRSSYDELISNVANLDESEIEMQLQFIRNSFHSFRALPFHHSQVEHYTSNNHHQFGDCLLIEKESLISEAKNIADNLIKTRILSPDESSAWIGMNFIPSINRYEFQLLDSSLYTGNAGIALFFAYLSKVTRNKNYAQASYSALQSIRFKIRHDPLRYARVLGIGGFHGITSVAYSMHHCGLILNDESLITDAKQALGGITLEQISKDKYFDVMLGSAGTLLVLFSVCSAFDDENLLKLALACGNQLLNSLASKEISTSHSVWGAFPRTGFSHGAAGIAYALFKLYLKTGYRKYFEGGLKLIEYENSHWNDKVQNWLDGDGERTFYGQAWCHGSPGIALGRLLCLDVIDNHRIKEDIERAIRKETTANLSQVDNLCCGTLGKVLILLETWKKLNCLDSLATAKQLIYELMKKRKQSGTYNLVAELPPYVCNPSLMQGLAGVGLALISIYNMFTNENIKLPSVLSLE